MTIPIILDTSPEAATSERFNVPGVLRMLDAEAAGAFQSERTKIELVARLIRAHQAEIQRLLAALQRIGNPHMVYASDDDENLNAGLSMRMADARATAKTSPFKAPLPDEEAP